MRSVVLSLSAVLLLTTLLTPAVAPADAGGRTLRPGDSLGGFCTLNFVFDGPGGEVYFGTAAHCVAVNDPGWTPGVGTWGVVVYDDDARTDFALIKVHTEFHEDVVAEVRGHPGLPTGSTTALETSTGDLLLFSGYGTGYSTTAITREKRIGLLTRDSTSDYSADAMIHWGDSGGPVLHAGTGKALGVVSRLDLEHLPPNSLTGPSVEGILDRLHTDGFPGVTLRTV